MAGRNTAVSGIYRLKNQAERALDMLIVGGMPCSSISVLLLDPADEGAIGGTIGVLAGAGRVAIAGVGRMIGAGPVMAGFAGARDATAEADIGDLCRALVGIGISDPRRDSTKAVRVRRHSCVCELQFHRRIARQRAVDGRGCRGAHGIRTGRYLAAREVLSVVSASKRESLGCFAQSASRAV